MPSISSASHPASGQPASKHPAKATGAVLAEAEAQWIFTEDELDHQTPSALDGMKSDVERELRSKGLNFITQVGVMLKLPQTTLYAAGVFFNRFLTRHSLVNKPDQPKALHHYQIAATSLFVATKTEETCRKVRDLIIACCRVAQKNPTLVVDEQSKDYWRWRDTILYNEDVLLEALCFDLTVEPPYMLLFDLLKLLSVAENKRLRNVAWAFVTDSCLTVSCLLFSARTIAAAAVYCAAKVCGPEVTFEDDARGRPWWIAHGKTRLIDMKRACNFMCRAYETLPIKSGEDRSFYVGLLTPEVGAAPEGEMEKTRLKNDVSLQTPASPLDGGDATRADATLQPTSNGVGTHTDGASKARDEKTIPSRLHGAKRDLKDSPRTRGERELTPGMRRAREDGADNDGNERASKAARTETINGSRGGQNIQRPSEADSEPRQVKDEDAGSEEGEVEE